MRILIAALGSAGDVHPFLGIGQALAGRGHSVVVCANPVFEPLIARCGFGFRALGDAQAYLRTLADPALWSPRTSLRVLWAAMARELRPLFDLLAAEADDDTVVLGSLWAFGARLAQEKLGIPYLGAQVSPSTLLSATLPPVHPRWRLPQGLPVAARAVLVGALESLVLDRTFGPALNELRRELGLAPASRILGRWVHSPQGVLGLFPDWFAPRQPDWPASFEPCGFPLFDAGGLERLDPALRGFLGDGGPPVIVTTGSTGLHGKAFFRAAMQALRRTGRRAVLLGEDAMAIPDLPSSMHARRYVPLSLLLGHGSALLHHGGIGTSALGLAAGLPQVVTPFAHDQFDNAARLERLGVSVTLPGPDALGIARALQHVSGDEAVAQACRRRRDQVEPAATARGRAVVALEALRPPVPRASRASSPESMDHVDA